MATTRASSRSALLQLRDGSRFGQARPGGIMTSRSTASRSQCLHGQAAEQLRRLCNPRVEAYCLASGGLAAGLARALRARRAGGTAPDPAGRRGRDRLAAPPPEIAGPRSGACLVQAHGYPSSARGDPVGSAALTIDARGATQTGRPPSFVGCTSRSSPTDRRLLDESARGAAERT